MTWWASGNAREPQGPQAREAGRPDRRLLGKSRAGTGPAPSQNIFIGNLVIVHGTGPTSGVFIYNGTPAAGNPPQIAEVPSGVTTDPYGNAITSSKILMQGNVITMAAGIFRTAATAPLIQIDGNHNAYLEYNAGAALSESIAPVATSDGLGNTVQAGFTAYGSANTTFTQLQSGKLLFKQSIDTTGPSIAELAGSAGVLQIFSGGTGALVVPCELQLFPVVSGQGAVLALNHILELIETPAVPAALAGVQLFASTTGHAGVVSDLTHGDSNTYGIERLIQRVSPRSQSFSAVAAANIGGLSVPVVAGTYFVRGRFIIEWNAAAGTPEMQFAGPAISQYDVSFKTRQSGSSSTANTNTLVSSGTVNGTGYNGTISNVAITGPMSSAGIFFDLDIWGMFVFTASGNLTLQAASSIATDAWIMFSGFWEIQPA